MSDNCVLKKVTYLSQQEVSPFINRLPCKNNVITLGFLNQYAYNLISQSTELKSLFLDLDFLLRDGVGIKIACKYHGLYAGENLNGTDLIPLIIKQLTLREKDIKFFAYGTREPWLTKGAKAIFQDKGFVYLDGFQSEKSYLDHFSVHRSENALNVVVLAMGMPKQERVAALLKENSSVSALILCGGAILDFQANRYNRAPVIFRKIGIEWLYRLCVEPKRMFYRYIIGIPIFFYNMVVSKV